MKVCMCSFAGYQKLNGSNLRAYFIAKEFLKRGHDLYYVVPGKGDAESIRERFGAKAAHVNIDVHRFSKSKLKLYPKFAFKASKIIKKDFDLVFGQSLPSALAVNSASTNALKVIDYVDLWSEYWLYANPSIKGKVIYKAVRSAESHSMKNANLVFTITEKLKELLKKRGCPQEKLRIVRDGVDLQMFYPFKVKNSFYEKYNLDKNTDYIVYQGGIAAHDGVQFLVNCAPLVLKENPSIKFLIVGTGDYLEHVKKLVDNANLNDSFIFTGWVDYEEMPFFMNLAKINVVPLPNAPATQSVVTYKLMEGISCGTPTIIGNLPGVREAVVHKKTAYLTRCEDKFKLANSINELLKDKNIYDTITKNGLKMIKDNDWRDIASEMVDIMEHSKNL